MNITIIGTGAYGIALSSLINSKNNIIMYTNSKSELEELTNNKTNFKALKDYKINNSIKITSNLKEAISNSDVIIIAIPADAFHNIIKKIKRYYKNQHIIIASKGIENNSCMFLSEIVLKHLKTNNFAIISGPSFAIDIIKKSPIGLSLATKSIKTKNIVINLFQNENLKLEYTNDLVGVQLCGAIKNVIAIASGIIDGLGFPESTQAMFITKSLTEISLLVKSLNGCEDTILTFAGFGDLLLTCTSTKSRNYTFGKMIGERKNKQIIEAYQSNTTIEGLNALKTIHKLINKNKVTIPIINLIYDIVYKEKNPNIIKDFLIK